jgi:hypothetical protein
MALEEFGEKCGLEGGSSTTANAYPTNIFTTTGDYTIQVTVDSNNEITENNEGNNVCTKTVTVYISCQDSTPTTAPVYGCVALSNCGGAGNYNPSSTYDDGWCNAKYGSTAPYCCNCPDGFEYNINLHQCEYKYEECGIGGYCTTSPWQDSTHCLRYTPIPYEDACCLDATYGTENYYTWIATEVSGGGTQVN